MWAVLPADWANSVETILASWVAKGSISLHAIRAGGQWFTSRASRCLFPARVRHVGVMVVVMEMMDWSAVIVLFSVGERLLRVMGVVRHILFVLVVGVVALMSHRVVILSVQAAVVVWTVIEMIRIIVGVMVAMLGLVMIAFLLMIFVVIMSIFIFVVMSRPICFVVILLLSVETT